MSVSAPSSASVASSILLHCEAAQSFPAPSLVWRIVDQMEEVVREVDTVMEEQEDGNMIATSDLRLDSSWISLRIFGLRWLFILHGW